MITFKAQYITSAQIQQNTLQNEWVPHDMSFVKIDPEEQADILAIGNMATNWHKYCRKGDKMFAFDIYRNLYFDSYYKAHDFFAITKQTENFKNLNSDDILGLVQITPKKDDLYEIELLQTHPDACFHTTGRRIKNVGSAIIDALKKIYPTKNIILVSVDEARGFYKKKGFVQDPHSKRLILYV